MIDSAEEPQNRLHGYLAVFGGICIHLFAGCLYLWGNISGYVRTYFHYVGDKHASADLSVMIIPLAFFIKSITNLIGAILH